MSSPDQRIHEIRSPHRCYYDDAAGVGHVVGDEHTAALCEAPIPDGAWVWSAVSRAWVHNPCAVCVAALERISNAARSELISERHAALVNARAAKPRPRVRRKK